MKVVVSFIAQAQLFPILAEHHKLEHREREKCRPVSHGRDHCDTLSFLPISDEYRVQHVVMVGRTFTGLGMSILCSQPLHFLCVRSLNTELPLLLIAARPLVS